MTGCSVVLDDGLKGAFGADGHEGAVGAYTVYMSYRLWISVVLCDAHAKDFREIGYYMGTPR